MSTVLLTTDGSDLATAAMTQALELLGRDHRFTSLAVVPNAFVPGAAVSPMETHPTVIDAQLEMQIEQEERKEGTADLAELDRVLSITSEHILEVGEPGPVICATAAKVSADVVVVGSHGHGLFQRMFVGSVSKHVVDHAPCPVLVIRLEDTDKS